MHFVGRSIRISVTSNYRLRAGSRLFSLASPTLLSDMIKYSVYTQARSAQPFHFIFPRRSVPFRNEPCDYAATSTYLCGFLPA